jgi:hypothetical protein
MTRKPQRPGSVVACPFGCSGHAAGIKAIPLSEIASRYAAGKLKQVVA